MKKRIVVVFICLAILIGIYYLFTDSLIEGAKSKGGSVTKLLSPPSSSLGSSRTTDAEYIRQRAENQKKK